MSESWQMQELKERLGMSIRSEDSFLNMTNSGHGLHNGNNNRSDLLTKGSRVKVVRGKRFEDFMSGDVGTILEVCLGGETCSVAFDTLSQPRQVALRHLQLDGKATNIVDTQTIAAQLDQITITPSSCENTSFQMPGLHIGAAPKPFAATSCAPRAPHDSSQVVQVLSSSARPPGVPPLQLPPRGIPEDFEVYNLESGVCMSSPENSRDIDDSERLGPKVHPPQNSPSSAARNASAESVFELQLNRQYDRCLPELEELWTLVRSLDERVEELSKHQFAFSEFWQQYPTLEALKQQEIDEKIDPLVSLQRSSQHQLDELAESVKQVIPLLNRQDADEKIDSQAPTQFQLDTKSRLDALSQAIEKIIHFNGTNGLKSQKEAEERLDRIDEKLRDLPSAIAESHQRFEKDLATVTEQVDIMARSFREQYLQDLHKQKSTDSTLEELQSHIASVRRTHERISGEVESLVEQHERNTEAVKDLRAKTERLDEMGQWGNSALVATQRLEAEAQKQYEAFEKRFAVLGSLEKTINDVVDGVIPAQVKRLESASPPFQAKLTNLEASVSLLIEERTKLTNLEASVHEHIQDATEKHTILQALRTKVEDLGEVGLYANEAMRIAKELHETVASRRASPDVHGIATRESHESQVSFGPNQPNVHCEIEKLDNQIQAQKTALQVFASGAEERFQSLEQRITESGEAYASESNRRELAMEKIELTCQEASKRITEAFLSKTSANSEADVPGMVQQFQAMMSEIRSNAKQSELSRREEVENAIGSLRAELDSFRERDEASASFANSMPSTISLASGRLSPQQGGGVLRLSSAPAREKPVAVAPSRFQKASVQSPDGSPHWTAVSSSPQLQSSRKSGPSRSSGQSSPLGARQSSPLGARLTPLVTRPRSFSPSQVRTNMVVTSARASTPPLAATPPLSATPPGSVTPMMSSRAEFPQSQMTLPSAKYSTLRISALMCRLCGNMCMDETDICRRCTLSQKNGSSAPNQVSDYSKPVPPPSAYPCTEIGNQSSADVPPASFGSYVLRHEIASTSAPRRLPAQVAAPTMPAGRELSSSSQGDGICSAE